ncbi:hypothetical protein AB0467_10100 [Streptomyces sp. NPDC052095]|uniref:hypothetical protein n=1 Tax=unclassified Streptomyces TaxID=2593676 RepID=UPI00344E154C
MSTSFVRGPAATVLRAELRRGIAPWTGPAVAVCLLVPMGAKAAEWQGGWAETQETLHTATALLGIPLLAAIACWQGGRERRRGTEELLRSVVRGRLARLVVAVGPLMLWAAAGQLLVLGAAFAATAPYAGPGLGPSLGLPVVDLGSLVAAAPVGFVVGRLVRWRLAAPVLAAVCYVLLGAPGYTRSPARYLSPAEDYMLEAAEPVWWFAPSLLAWSGGVAATVLLAYAARRRLLALLPLVLTVLAGAVVVQTGDGMLRPDPAGSRRVCSAPDAGTPQLCVPASLAPVLPDAAEALTEVFARLDGVEGAPGRYVASGSRPSRTKTEAPLGYVTRGWGVHRDRLDDPRAFAQDTVLSLLDTDCPDDRRTRDRAAADRAAFTEDALRTWLTGGNATWNPKARPYLARLEAMPDPERGVWIGRFLTGLRNCAPEGVPVL